MAVYNVYGQDISNTYDLNGDLLEQAYDINENPLIPTNPNELVVMTYNVQKFEGLNGNLQMQDDILSEYDPLIIGLQELGTAMPSSGNTVLRNYPYIDLGTQVNKTGLASKCILNDAVSVNFATQASETRGYQKAYFTFNEKTICWINTHLETSSYESVKVAQAREIFNLVQNESYFIITGDFNTVCKSVNDTEYTTIMKQFIDAGYQSANCSLQHGFINTWTDGNSLNSTWYPCDHIITSSNIDIDDVIDDQTKVEVAALTGQTIDHIPLIAFLTVN